MRKPWPKTLLRRRGLGRRGGKRQDRVEYMRAISVWKLLAAMLLAFSLTACGGVGSLGNVGFGGATDAVDTEEDEIEPVIEGSAGMSQVGQTSIFDLFKRRDTGTTVKVNRYLWNASLDVLNFMPIQSIDPFTGVIVMGYGRPPGGGRAYRATVYIKDPALDARSLNVALATRGGPVAEGTQRAVEDAILSRARQLRIQDKKF